MSTEVFIDKPIKKGKCACCGDREWLFRYSNRLICGCCKQEKQMREMTMRGENEDKWL